MIETLHAIAVRISKLLRNKWGKSQHMHNRFRIDVAWQRPSEENNGGSKDKGLRTGEGENMVVRITLEGIILQQEAATLQKFLDGVVDSSFSRLIFDLTKVPTISQRGIEALLGFRNKLKKRNLEVEIHGIHPIVSQTLKELGLENAFVIRRKASQF